MFEDYENQEMFLDQPASLGEVLLCVGIFMIILSIVGLIIYSIFL